jgi:hypothetical protein
MRTIASEKVSSLRSTARVAELAMDPHELGTARQTRHSFSRALVRHASQEGWKISKRVWEIDDKGRGHAIIRVELGGHIVELVVFSQVIDEEMRTDRVIAQDWDVTSALVDGEVSPERLEILRNHVTKQEDGRADDMTLIWARANRSQRFFNYVADRLASGHQPEPDAVSDAAYILRSTAFYGNGKWGLRDFEGIGSSNPLGVPYRAQMLAAWLLREFSADLADHCARCRNENAVPLAREWRRYLGLGNATGLGMVPYVIRHPQVLDAWVSLRELPLTNALSQNWSPESAQWSRVCALLARAKLYFSQKKSFTTDPYPSGPVLADLLTEIVDWANQYKTSGEVNGSKVSLPARVLSELAAERSTEVRQIVDSVLVEIDSSLDGDMESLLVCVDRTQLNPAMSVADLRKIIESQYYWVENFDFKTAGQTSRFWFYSRNNQEPRRGLRGKDKGLITEHPVGVAKDVVSLMHDLWATGAETSTGEFLSLHPEHWGIIERIQSVEGLVYTEAHVNPLADDFLPLDLQRFQLATYGMENYNPQSTDWLRVTLYSGAPTVADVQEGVDVDDWLFLPRPEDVG